VESACHAVVAIHQDDRRMKGARPYIDFGVSVLRVTGPESWELVGATGCSVERQLEVDVDLEPGEEYLIVPCTTGAKFMQQDRCGVLSLFLIVMNCFSDSFSHPVSRSQALCTFCPRTAPSSVRRRSHASRKFSIA
jgi:hypothetical protein